MLLSLCVLFLPDACARYESLAQTPLRASFMCLSRRPTACGGGSTTKTAASGLVREAGLGRLLPKSSAAERPGPGDDGSHQSAAAGRPGVQLPVCLFVGVVGWGEKGSGLHPG